jgi:cell division protein ZapA
VNRPPPRYTVTVDIAGERHVLRSDAPPEYTRAVAAHVDETLRRMGGGSLEQHRAAILAALSITDELFRTREALESLRTEMEERCARLSERLDAAARPPTGDEGRGGR